jgi:hypothetical protein
MQLWCVEGNQELRIVPQPPDWRQDKKNGRCSGINKKWLTGFKNEVKNQEPDTRRLALAAVRAHESNVRVIATSQSKYACNAVQSNSSIARAPVTFVNQRLDQLRDFHGSLRVRF